MYLITLWPFDLWPDVIVLTCIKSILSFNHCICTFDFFLTFVSCLLTVTLHIVDARLTCLINITYLLTYLLTYLHGSLLIHRSLRHGWLSWPCWLTDSGRLTGRLHGPIVGPTGRSDPGYVRLSVRPVGETVGQTVAEPPTWCQSNQCGLLADYNTAYAAAWLVVRLASRSDSRT